MMVHVHGNWFCLLYGSDGQVPNCPTDELSFSSRTGPNQMSLTWRHLHQFCKLTLFQGSMVWWNPRQVHFGVLKLLDLEFVFFVEECVPKRVHTFILPDECLKCNSSELFFLVHRVALVFGLCFIFHRKVNFYSVVLLLRRNWHYNNSVGCSFLLPNVSKAFAHNVYVLATGRTSRS